MNKKYVALILIFFFVFSFSACKQGGGEKTAEPVGESTEEVVEAVDYDELSLKELELLALEKDGEAAYRVGLIYDYGLEGESQNFQKAKEWYEAAAKNDCADGYLGLGYLYLSGAGVTQNYETALELFQTAESMHCLEGYAAEGRTYLEMGDESKYGVAYNCFKKASEAGVLDGTCYLGYLYEEGINVVQNVDLSMLAYAAVLKNGSDDIREQYAINFANTRLGIIYASGKGGHFDEKLAIDYFEAASDNGYAQATYYLGTMYQMGRGTDRDYERALALYELAAESDYAPALSQIGYFYFNGLGVEPDYNQAVYYEKLAAAQGYAPAEINLGFLYENGLGVEENHTTALQYYRLAESQGYEGAAEAVMRVENLMRGDG